MKFLSSERNAQYVPKWSSLKIRMFQTRGPGEAASGAPAGGTEHAEGRLAATEDQGHGFFAVLSRRDHLADGELVVELVVKLVRNTYQFKIIRFIFMLVLIVIVVVS